MESIIRVNWNGLFHLRSKTESHGNSLYGSRPNIIPLRCDRHCDPGSNRCTITGATAVHKAVMESLTDRQYGPGKGRSYAVFGRGKWNADINPAILIACFSWNVDEFLRSLFNVQCSMFDEKPLGPYFIGAS